jgi:hypothetical protein
MLLAENLTVYNISNLTSRTCEKVNAVYYVRLSGIYRTSLRRLDISILSYGPLLCS